MSRPDDEMIQHEYEPPVAEGTVARRATLLTTGLGGASGTLLGLATHGPAGLFFGVLGTAAVLALEYHGTPEEYAAVTRSVRAARRWLARAREERATREDQEDAPVKHSSPLPRSPYNANDDTDEETEPLPWLPDPFGAEPAPHDDRFGEEPAEPREQALRFSVSSHFTLSQVLTLTLPQLDRVPKDGIDSSILGKDHSWQKFRKSTPKNLKKKR